MDVKDDLTDHSQEARDEQLEDLDSFSSLKEESSKEESPKEKVDSVSSEEKSPKERYHNPLLADLREERKRRQSLQRELKEMSMAMENYQSQKEELETLQATYSRVEELLKELNSEAYEILDRRSFRKRILESDEKMQDIVKEWKSSNPSLSRKALGSSSKETPSSPNMNDLLRAAALGN